MLFKDRPWFEKPREKAIKMGFQNLSNADLLAILLNTGTKETSVLAVAENLLNHFNGLNNLLTQATLPSLTAFTGIGNSKAIKILAIIEINRRFLANQFLQTSQTKVINHPLDLQKLYPTLFPRSLHRQEVFYLISLTKTNELITYNLLFKGSRQSLVVDLRVIIETAFFNHASKIICLHNHPSGNPLPSQNDLQTTETLLKLCQKLGLGFVDHLIFTSSYQIYSLFLKKHFSLSIDLFK